MHSPKSGIGSKKFGGRWNPKGLEVIYGASSRSLAVLEILVHNSVLDTDYGVTEIRIPEDVEIETLLDEDLPANWDAAVYDSAAQQFGQRWLAESRSAVLSVPSKIVKQERNLLLNPAHSDFELIEFAAAEAFVFDSRLRLPNPPIL